MAGRFDALKTCRIPNLVVAYENNNRALFNYPPVEMKTVDSSIGG